MLGEWDRLDIVLHSFFLFEGDLPFLNPSKVWVSLGSVLRAGKKPKCIEFSAHCVVGTGEGMKGSFGVVTSWLAWLGLSGSCPYVELR